MPKMSWFTRKACFPDAQTQVAVNRQPVQTSTGPHRHEFIEIVIVLSGQGVHVTEGVRHQVRAGDVLVINSSRSHAYENTHRLSLVNILVREDVFRETEKHFRSLPGYHALFTLEPVRWRQREFTSHLRLKPEDLQQAVVWVDTLEAATAASRLRRLRLVAAFRIAIISRASSVTLSV